MDDRPSAPLPANTLAAFTTLRNQCDGALKKAYSDARAVWRGKAETLAKMAADLAELNQAWYADATRVFVAGEPEGDMIRGRSDDLRAAPQGAGSDTAAHSVAGAAAGRRNELIFRT